MELDTRGGAQPRNVVPFERTQSDLEDECSRCTFSDDQCNTSDEFDQAFDGDHHIEYWLWNGARLVPALPDEGDRSQQREAWELRKLPQTNERRYGAVRPNAGVTAHRHWLLDSRHTYLVAILHPSHSNANGAQDTLSRRA